MSEKLKKRGRILLMLNNKILREMSADPGLEIDE